MAAQRTARAAAALKAEAAPLTPAAAEEEKEAPEVEAGEAVEAEAAVAPVEVAPEEAAGAEAAEEAASTTPQKQTAEAVAAASEEAAEAVAVPVEVPAGGDKGSAAGAGTPTSLGAAKDPKQPRERWLIKDLDTRTWSEVRKLHRRAVTIEPLAQPHLEVPAEVFQIVV